MKLSVYYFCVKPKILVDFHTYISVHLNVLNKIYLFTAYFILSVCECFTFFFINGMFFIKSYLQMCLYSSVYDAIFLFRNKREQKHRVPDTYHTNNDNANVIKFMKVASN